MEKETEPPTPKRGDPEPPKWGGSSATHLVIMKRIETLPAAGVLAAELTGEGGLLVDQ